MWTEKLSNGVVLDHGLSYMWQSHVESEYSSVAYCDCVTAFNCCISNLPLRVCSYTMCSCVDSCCIYTACLNPALNRSSKIQHFERNNEIEICNRIILNSKLDCHIRTYSVVY